MKAQISTNYIPGSNCNPNKAEKVKAIIQQRILYRHQRRGFNYSSTDSNDEGSTTHLEEKVVVSETQATNLYRFNYIDSNDKDSTTHLKEKVVVSEIQATNLYQLKNEKPITYWKKKEQLQLKIKLKRRKPQSNNELYANTNEEDSITY
ncbi:14538_t:CDS:2 [Gigaspora rosea]|nr:14538_t:CDS:2 [Gigaspora rosea]